MTVYGDLDVSVLDELPPGRTPITTVWARAEPLAGGPEEAPVWERVRAEVAAGPPGVRGVPAHRGVREAGGGLGRGGLRRAHRPRRRAGRPAGRAAARAGAARPRRSRPWRCSAPARLDVLVATTVIEVGVDVPNATVMVILDADRFGIAQLHQLRGRVGRGAARVVLLPAGPGRRRRDGEERLAAMVRTTDGFELAEVDLDLRGEGTIMGERQKGRNDLKLASLRRDREWVVKARDVAFELVGDDPHLGRPPAAGRGGRAVPRRRRGRRLPPQVADASRLVVAAGPRPATPSSATYSVHSSPSQ